MGRPLSGVIDGRDDGGHGHRVGAVRGAGQDGRVGPAQDRVDVGAGVLKDDGDGLPAVGWVTRGAGMGRHTSAFIRPPTVRPVRAAVNAGRMMRWGNGVTPPYCGRENGGVAPQTTVYRLVLWGRDLMRVRVTLRGTRGFVSRRTLSET